MPISPENRNRYPDNWKTEIRPEVLERDGHRCKFCQAENYRPHPITGSTVVLTIMHLDHNPENNGEPGNRPNLAAGCQRCHNRYDSAHRQRNRAETRRKKLEKEIDHAQRYA